MGLNREFVAETIAAKSSLSLRGYDVEVLPLRNNNCYQYLWRTINKVHTISDYLLVKAHDLGLSKNIDYEKIPPAIDIDKFKFKEFKKFNPIINFTTVARLTWQKGIEYTLHSLSILKKSGIKFNYNIIGEGPDFERLVFASYQLDIIDEVKFLGKISHRLINQYLNESDIYLQYSTSEGFCNSVLEAQASGCLCISSDAGGLKENIINNKSGWIVEKRNPNLLAKKIIKFCLMMKTI